MTVVDLECSFCGNDLTEGEVKYPIHDEDGKPICESCECEHYHFTCCLCSECEHVDFQHDLLVVVDSEAGIPTGTYRIISRPYYTTGLVGESWIHGEDVHRIGEVPDGVDCDRYPAGHLCRGCTKKILQEYSEAA